MSTARTIDTRTPRWFRWLRRFRPGHRRTRGAGGPAPTRMFVQSGFGQTTTTRSAFPVPIVVRVADADGALAVGAVVTIGLSADVDGALATATFDGGASSVDVVVGDDGAATSPRILAGEFEGAVTATCSVRGTSLRDAGPLFIDPARPESLVVVGGDDQTAPCFGPFAEPLEVRITDRDGHRPAGTVVVEFSIDSRTAEFVDGTFAARALIDDTGRAVSPALRALGSAGAVAASASALQDGVPVPLPAARFLATVLPQVPVAIVVTGGDAQYAPPGGAFALPAGFQVLDRFGHGVRSAQVHVEVTGPATADGQTSFGITVTEDGTLALPLLAGMSGGPVAVVVTETSTGASAVLHAAVPGRGVVRLEAQRGDRQEVCPGEPFDALGVLLTDGDAEVLPDLPVVFTVQGPASFSGGSPCATATSSTDVTYAPLLRATDDPAAYGPVEVRVTLPGNSASTSFALDVLRIQAMVVTGGDGQSATPNTSSTKLVPFKAKLSVQATEHTGAPAAGVPVEFVVDGPASLDGARSTRADVVSDRHGSASVSLYPGRDIGPVGVTASATGFNSVTFTATVRPPSS